MSEFRVVAILGMGGDAVSLLCDKVVELVLSGCGRHGGRKAKSSRRGGWGVGLFKMSSRRAVEDRH
jgi:hypothetical protein